MCKPSEYGFGRWVAAVAAVLLAVANPSTATVTSPAADAEASPSSERAGYQLRCWQEGRLLFEDGGVRLPSGVGQMRVVAVDRGGRPIYLFESAQATCQLRHRDDRAERRSVP